jgi:hypothetical protein
MPDTSLHKRSYILNVDQPWALLPIHLIQSQECCVLVYALDVRDARILSLLSGPLSLQQFVGPAIVDSVLGQDALSWDKISSLHLGGKYSPILIQELFTTILKI